MGAAAAQQQQQQPQPRRRQEEEVDAQHRQPGPRRAPPMTAAQFLSWKLQKDAIASARKAEAAQKRADEIAAGVVQMNGRELFLNEPWVFDNSRY